MTEGEAKEKWCPFARLKVADRVQAGDPVCNEPQTTFNRLAVNGRPEPMLAQQGMCLGSGCMAWRWWEDRNLESGFCGLAGFHYANQRGP